jgi:hypothetical protein
MIVSRRSRIILPLEPAEAEDGERMRRDYSLVHEQRRLRAQISLPRLIARSSLKRIGSSTTIKMNANSGNKGRVFMRDRSAAPQGTN